MPAYPTYDPNKQQPASSDNAPAPQQPAGAYPTYDPNKQPAPVAAGGGGSGGGAYPTFDPNKGSEAGTGTWGDFGSVMSNESMMNSLPGLRTQAEAARQRLGPNWAAAADVAGSIASPSTLLNMVPGVGPELAGGVHEGVKSYMSQPNWWPDAAGREQILKDTAFGAATAGLGHGGAVLAPKLLPDAVKWTPLVTAPGAAAHYIHNLTGDVGWDLVGASGVGAALYKPLDWAKKGVEQIADQPATQNMIKLLAQGAGSAFRNASPGPLWDQYVPQF